MLEYIFFLATRAILQFLCNFIPFKNARKKARNAVFEKYLSDKIIMLNEVDSLVPREVLAQINACDNKYFIAKNRRICPKFVILSRVRSAKRRNSICFSFEILR